MDTANSSPKNSREVVMKSESRSRSRSRSRASSHSTDPGSKKKLSKSSKETNGKQRENGNSHSHSRDNDMFNMLKSLTTNVKSLADKVGKLEEDKARSRSKSRHRSRSSRYNSRSWKKSSRGSRDRSSSDDSRDSSLDSHRGRSSARNGKDKYRTRSRSSDLSRDGSRSRSRESSGSRSRSRKYRSETRSRSSSLEGRYRKKSYASEANSSSHRNSNSSNHKTKALLDKPNKPDRDADSGDLAHMDAEFNEKANGEAVEPSLADVLNSGFTEYLSDVKLTKYTGELKVPENCENLTTPNLNRELYAKHIKLGKFAIRNDTRLANIQRLVLKAAVAVAQSATVLHKSKSESHGRDDSPSMTLHHTAIELIGHAHQELSVRRREILHSSIPDELSSMCFLDVDPGPKLFGEDVDGMMKEASKHYWTNSFKRGGFPVRRFQPYTRGRPTRAFHRRVTGARPRGPTLLDSP